MFSLIGKNFPYSEKECAAHIRTFDRNHYLDETFGTVGCAHRCDSHQKPLCLPCLVTAAQQACLMSQKRGGHHDRKSKAYRRRVLKSATIEFGSGAYSCAVRNLSGTGAFLVFHTRQVSPTSSSSEWTPMRCLGLSRHMAKEKPSRCRVQIVTLKSLVLSDSLPDIIPPALAWAVSGRTYISSVAVKTLVSHCGRLFLERCLGRTRVSELLSRYTKAEVLSGLRGAQGVPRHRRDGRGEEEC
jgi:hypothetical protein